MTIQHEVEEIPYWLHINGDGDMAENENHANLIYYFKSVLVWFYRLQGWYVSTNMLIIQPGYDDVSPDIALYIGLVLSPEERNTLKSWRLGEPNRPAPSVVFEICSDGTWPNDVRPQDKPLRYQQMGVKEYFLYDPSTPRLWTEPDRRLCGWRYDGRQGEVFLIAQEILPDERGWLFSEQLNAFLAPDGQFLRLRDLQGNLLLNGDEAARQADKAARQAQQTAQEALRREAEILAKLKAKGINPDDL